MAAHMLIAKIMRVQKALTDAPIRTPALVVIGTWDPLVQAHRELFQEIASHGARVGLTPVVVILFPSPVRLLYADPRRCLEYADINARVTLIRECADVKILIARLTKRDLDASCGSFLDVIGSYLHLRELWLGAGQTLGRGPQGSVSEIANVASSRNISLHRMSACDRSCVVGAAALQLLGEGQMKEAIQCVGHGPIWRRPKSGLLKLNWPPGEYLAVSIAKPSLAPIVSSTPISVRVSLAKDGSHGTLKWPGRHVKWLSFVAGPADNR